MNNRANHRVRSIGLLLILVSLVGIQTAFAQTAEDTVNKARDLMNQTKFEESLATLQPLLPVSQNDIEVQYLVGLAKVMLKDYEGSLPALRRAKEIDPSDPQIRYLLGRAYAEMGDLANALDELQAVFGTAPSTPDLGYHLGKVHYQDTRYPPARDVLSVAVSSHDLMRQKVHFLLGLAYERLGDTAKSNENLRTAVNIAPDTELGRGIAARLAKDTGDQKVTGSSGDVAPTAPLRSRENAKKLGVDAYASLLYDDNARLDPKAFAGDPIVTALRAVPGGRNDSGFNIAVRPEYTFHNNDKTRMSVSYFGSHTSYFDLDANDFTNHELALNWFHRKSNEDDPLYSATLSFDTSELGDNDFLDRFTFAPSMTVQSSRDPDDGTVFYGLLQRRNFDQQLPVIGEDRSGTLAAAGVTHYHFWGDKNRHNVRIGLLGDRDRTEGTNYRYDGLRPSVGATLGFWTDAAFSIDAFHHIREYDSVNTIFGIGRFDHQTTVAARLSKPVNDDLTAFLSGTLDDTRSNIPVFAFERDQISAGVHYRY